MDTHKMDNKGLVFGLDIGTRNVVGTVGYRDEDETFHVIAQYSREHDTRSMLDGQIHDIRRVGKTIQFVKARLEEQIEQPLTEVCIAAAGRVLKTVTTDVEYEFAEESVVTGEMIHTLELLGVEKAHNILREENDTKYRFYCVGYSVMKYYINGEVYSNLEGHKAEVISADIIATFLPEDVVDGLYAAVALADLEVANLTLEPIAAINVAIPEHFRMLNIALVDVGAGTSDICITRDGSIVAYGMIPYAGDELTEVIVQHYLVDFRMAEHIKMCSTVDEEIEFEDIMSITHHIPAEEVWELVDPLVEKMAKGVAEKIIALNGDKTVSATFIVGGGGKVHGFVERLAEELNITQERVALRGEEVLKQIDFMQPDIEKDPLIVTPVGICLNYYDQKNNFIMVRFNGERIKLYDNSRLTVVDAALQAGFPNDHLFPRRGRAINFTVNGKQRMIRGEAGESSVVRMNGREVNINTPLEPNCEIELIPSTVGADAVCTIEHLEEYTASTIGFEVNHRMVTCPRFVLVGGRLEPPAYRIKDGDQIEVCSYYTVAQLAEFMDVEVDMDEEILVNNREENMDARVYENFSVDWTVLSYRTAKEDMEPEEPGRAHEEEPEAAPVEYPGTVPSERLETAPSEYPERVHDEEPEAAPVEKPEASSGGQPEQASGGKPEAAPGPDESAKEGKKVSAEGGKAPMKPDEEAGKAGAPEKDADAPDTRVSGEEEHERAAITAQKGAAETAPGAARTGTAPDKTGKEAVDLAVMVNGEIVVMHGKPSYVFIDVFDYIDFDLSDSRGRGIITLVNEKNALYTQTLHEGDEIVICWEEK